MGDVRVVVVRAVDWVAAPKGEEKAGATEEEGTVAGKGALAAREAQRAEMGDLGAEKVEVAMEVGTAAVKEEAVTAVGKAVAMEVVATAGGKAVAMEVVETVVVRVAARVAAAKAHGRPPIPGSHLPSVSSLPPALLLLRQGRQRWHSIGGSRLRRRRSPGSVSQWTPTL